MFDKGNIDLMKLGGIFCSILYTSIARLWRFLSWMVNDLSISRSSKKDDTWSLYTRRKDLSCNLFILLFKVRLWNIHINGQYPNWDSMKALFRIRNFSLFVNFEILARACNFRPAFLHMLDTCSVKSSLLLILTPTSFTHFFPLIISCPIFNDTSSSWLVINRLHLSLFSKK